MYCPECGNDAGDANFCPSCGNDLKGVRRGKGGPKAGAGAPAKQASSGAASSGISPAIIWGGFAVVAVVVVLVVLLAGNVVGGDEGSAATGESPAAAPAEPVEADTSGSYRELVQRANGLYDQGDKAFQEQNFEQGSNYFRAAAQVYAAAWKKEAGDPNVGTDWAVSMFYSGDTEGAIKQADAVLVKNPKFQPAWLNVGNFYAHTARFAEQSGDQKAADKAYDKAREAYTRAVAIDPQSDVGKTADQALQALPK